MSKVGGFTPELPAGGSAPRPALLETTRQPVQHRRAMRVLGRCPQRGSSLEGWGAAPLALLLLVLGTLAANAQDAAGAIAPVQTLDAALVASMKAPSFAARSALLAPVVDATFDLPGILRAVVGLRWASIPPDQQTALLTAFRSFTIASYAANFAGYTGQTVSVVPPPRAVGADQLVQTNIVSDGSTNRIDYQMRAVGGAWKAEDVLLDGSISNVAVQRSDFRKLLAGGDAKPLIDSLTKRAAALAIGTT